MATRPKIVAVPFKEVLAEELKNPEFRRHYLARKRLQRVWFSSWTFLAESGTRN